MHRPVLLVLALAEFVVAAGWLLVARKSLRTGKAVREIRGSIPLVVVGVLLSVGFVWVALTS